jgi:hypothetical protein
MQGLLALRPSAVAASALSRSEVGESGQAALGRPSNLCFFLAHAGQGGAPSSELAAGRWERSPEDFAIIRCSAGALVDFLAVVVVRGMADPVQTADPFQMFKWVVHVTQNN